MFTDFRERARNIHQLPAEHTLTGKRTRNPLLCGTMLQTTEPLGQGPVSFFIAPSSFLDMSRCGRSDKLGVTLLLLRSGS